MATNFSAAKTQGGKPQRAARQAQLQRLALQAALSLGLLAGCERQQPQLPVEQACPRPAELNIQIDAWREQGGRVDWGLNNRIAFDSVGPNSVYNVYSANPDGSDERCLTCGMSPPLPTGHKGNPAWHPTGRYLVFQAEKPSRRASSKALPGLGGTSDLWLMTSDGKQFYQLTVTPANTNSGVLHPHFSGDGRKLLWSQMYQEPNLRVRGQEFGYWKLMLADITFGQTGPVMANIQEFEPLGPAIYESHGFAPDGRTVLFSTNATNKGAALQRNDIFTLDTVSGVTQALTQEAYNEHAHFSPDGSRVIWMSNVDNTNKGTDLWIMNSDGTNKQRLTYFNIAPCAEYSAPRSYVADNSWNPDGSRIIAYVQTNLLTQQGRLVMIDVPEAAR